MRNKEIESIIIRGKIEGKRSKGRQTITYTKSLSECMNEGEVEMIRSTVKHDRQRKMEHHDRLCWGPAGYLEEEEVAL